MKNTAFKQRLTVHVTSANPSLMFRTEEPKPVWYYKQDGEEHVIGNEQRFKQWENITKAKYYTKMVKKRRIFTTFAYVINYKDEEHVITILKEVKQKGYKITKHYLSNIL